MIFILRFLYTYIYISITMRAFQIVLQVYFVRGQMFDNTILGCEEIWRFFDLLLLGLLFLLFIELPSFGTNLVMILRIMVILTSLKLIYVWSCSVGMLSKQINYIFSGLFFCIFYVLFWGFILYCSVSLFIFMLVSVNGLMLHTLFLFICFYFSTSSQAPLLLCYYIKNDYFQ